jgi:hypothetical protein
MKKRILAILAALVVVASFTVPAFAAVNINKGPSFTDNGLYLSASGKLTGLGNTDIVVSLSATGHATATCTNPSGKKQPPGHNPSPVTLTGTQAIPASEIKNGNVNFNVRTDTPVTPIPPSSPDFACPGSNWVETITDVSFTGATLTVEQGGIIVLTKTWSFSPPTTDGLVPAKDVKLVT